jgi:uncharacterized membrane protein
MGARGTVGDAERSGGLVSAGWTSSRVRLGVMLVVGGLAAALTGLFGSWLYAPVAGWDAAAAVFVLWVWSATIGPMSSAQTAAHSTREDPGNAATDLFVLTAAVASLAAVGIVLIQATSAKGAAQDLLAGFGVGSVALSWFAVHTLFTLRYARLYYTGIDGGVNFNQKTPPRYLDFAYLAFTLGMTFQVSDTDLERASIRATALRHALLSYLFGAVILATTINLVAGLGTSSGGSSGGG